MGGEVGVLCGWVCGGLGFEAGVEVVGGGSAMGPYLLLGRARDKSLWGGW